MSTINKNAKKAQAEFNKNEKKAQAEIKNIKNEAKTITDSTLFVVPMRTIIVNEEWICQNIPCIVLYTDSTQVTIKPFNKSRNFDVPIQDFNDQFVPLVRDAEFVYTEHYPTGKIHISEFSVNPISIAELKNHFDNDPNFVKLLKKVENDSYGGKGNNSCIIIKDFCKFKENPQSSKLERVGDPIFNRSTRHTVPVPKDLTRENYEQSPSFPAPIGIRLEDFSWPSEQNEILCELLTQIFNCVNAPECPVSFKEKFSLIITPNSHMCEWCGETMDIQDLNQVYCSKEHSVNFCHRDPLVGTKKGNVYIGHCSCNREQGGYSEDERIKQIIRLAKYNSKYREMILAELL
jgi:hypothetical protein